MFVFVLAEGDVDHIGLSRDPQCRVLVEKRKCRVGDQNRLLLVEPEYRSNDSAYVKLHESGTVPT